MKNNLLALKSCDVDERLPTHGDFLDLVITNKMDDGDFVDVLSEITASIHRELSYEDDYYDDDDDYYMDEGIFCERLQNSENQPDLLYAGYTDCMDEAIRFLVEEENISPEHPVITNLKAHLEKSKEKILETFPYADFSFSNEQLPSSADNNEKNSPIASIYMETFQSCRDSG